MVGLTISDEMEDEMEEDFGEACANLERIINRQHQRIIRLEVVAKSLIDWWEQKGSRTTYLHQITAMAQKALKP